MITNKDFNQAEFVNKGHKAHNGKNVSVIVVFDDLDFRYDFHIGYLSKDINPIASIAGDDTLQPCFDPILSGYAKINAHGKVVGKTNQLPKALNKPQSIHDIKIGLKLVNHNLHKYDNYLADHNYTF